MMKWDTSMDAATLDAAWKGIGERRDRARRARRLKIAAAPLLTAALIAILVVIVGHRARSTVTNPASLAAPVVTHLTLRGGAALPPAWDSPREPRVIDFDDGSHLLLATGTRIKTVPSRDARHVDLLLELGAVTFDIEPGGPRTWLIDAGNGTRVRVLGTRFTVTRDRRHVRVSVLRGKVRVESPSVEADLVAGQELDVGTNEVDPAAPAVPVESLAPAAKPITSRKAPTATAPNGAPTAAEADPFAEADAARRAGRPRDAIVILKGVERERALAAFTIGKIHAEELGEPAVAATWFERAIQLGLASGLEEDAYARVVESRGQAGLAEEAARAAEQYEAKFPSGRHLACVKRWSAKR